MERNWAIGCMVLGTHYVWRISTGDGWITLAGDWQQTLPLADRMTLANARKTLSIISAQYPQISAYLVPLTD